MVCSTRILGTDRLLLAVRLARLDLCKAAGLEENYSSGEACGIIWLKKTHRNTLFFSLKEWQKRLGCRL